MILWWQPGAKLHQRVIAFQDEVSVCLEVWWFFKSWLVPHQRPGDVARAGSQPHDDVIVYILKPWVLLLAQLEGGCGYSDCGDV